MSEDSQRPPTLTPEDDELLRGLAATIQRRGLATPAVLWLESVRPLAFLGAQAMHFLSPFVPGSSFSRLATILEERSHLERLLGHIEDAAAGQARPPATKGAAERLHGEEESPS